MIDKLSASDHANDEVLRKDLLHIRVIITYFLVNPIDIIKKKLYKDSNSFKNTINRKCDGKLDLSALISRERMNENIRYLERSFINMLNMG